MTAGGSEGPGDDKRCYMLIGLAVTDERVKKKERGRERGRGREREREIDR